MTKFIRKFKDTNTRTQILESINYSIINAVQGQDTIYVDTYVPNPPNNLTITCSDNIVTITANYATTIQYNFDNSDTWIDYTEPFEITETVTVYAKAINKDGEITKSQLCEYVKPIDYTIPLYIENILPNTSNTITFMCNNTSRPKVSLEYSKDNSTWTSWGSSTTSGITVTLSAGEKLYLRNASNPGYFNKNMNYYNYLTSSGNVNVGGNILSLARKNWTKNDTVSQGYAFSRVFYTMKVVDASGLALSATSERCYQYMFAGCTSLTTAPALPATTLANSCYFNMFNGCTSLTTAPALPATTLVTGCYYSMFTGCTSLTTAPALPATTLESSCYSSMFQGCTSLTTTPELTATTLAYGCYSGMFSGCTSLTTAPALPATTLASSCYSSMFNGCTSLTTAPALPATTLASSCYSSMFKGCTSLTTAPELPATTLESSCYSNMFNGCTSLTTAPELPATTLASNCYEYMLQNCTYLTTAPELPATTLAERCYQHMFNGCTSLTTAPELPATTLAGNCYWSMFQGCTSLTTTPELPATTLADSCYTNMFTGCTSLTTAPELTATTLAYGCYRDMFYNCTSLTTAPELPATTLANYCYYRMFGGCSSLTTAPELPATTLADGCYYYMFNGCTSLTTAPELPATTLASYCYEYMFQNCSHLNQITCLATNKSASNCLKEWVKGVSSTGTFYKDSSTTWSSGVSGIPSGWTVKDYCIDVIQSLNVATIVVGTIDENTGYYTINSEEPVSVSANSTISIPITEGMNGQTLFVHVEMDGEATEKSLVLEWIDYSPIITITETDNYVTITAPNSDSITYRLGDSGEYTTYTTPVYIAASTIIYVIAIRTVSDVVYQSESSQEVTHEVVIPTNLSIECSNNIVTISADNATSYQYKFNESDDWINYAGPFKITETVTVYAKAISIDGEAIEKSLVLEWIDYSPIITITETDNYVTITAPNSDSITYRLGDSGEYVVYTEPIYIESNTTIYVIATRTLSEVVYTSNTSQEVTHEVIPPTDLVISCSSNTVTITATNATTIEYNTDGSSTYTTYTEPFVISQTVTVYAKATNVDGSITASQECVYSTIPFATDCVFYAPLGEGDLTDHISGAVGITDTQSSTGSSSYYATCTWNSSVGAYDMYSVGRSDYNDYSSPLRFDNLTLFSNVGTDKISSRGITLYMQIYELSYTGNHYGFMFIADDAQVAWSNYQHTTGNHASGTYLSTGTCYLAIRGAAYGSGAQGSFHKCVLTVTSSGSVTWYLDGVSKASGNWSNNIKGNPTSCAVLQQQSGTGEQRAYIKDLRIYNRCLSASEVAQL